MRREHANLIGQPAQPDLQGGQRLQREVHREVRTEEVGARDRAEHHGAAGEERARPPALAEEVRLVVGSVAGSVDRLDGDVAELQLRPGRELADIGARFGLELAPSRDEVVVQVRVERVRQLDVQVGGDVKVALDVAQRVDDQPHATIGVGNEKARVAQLGRRDRLDRVHRLSCRSGRSSGEPRS